MNFKKILPYLLFGTTLIVPRASGALSNDKKRLANEENFDLYAYAMRMDSIQRAQEKQTAIKLDQRADSLCDAYMENMLTAQKKLKPMIGTHYYRAAVRQELPGAPVGQHCMFGQYTQLTRAQNEIGDTLTLIPDGARMACSEFKRQMRKKYSGAPSCIFEGVMYASDSVYNEALKKHLKKRKINENSPDSVRNAETEKFAKNHFSADSIRPGSILIVPRFRGSRNTFHAIMFLGRGVVKNGNFVPDSNGRHIYVGHNRENIGDLFDTYDTSNVFAANIKTIARTEYARAENKKQTHQQEPAITKSHESGYDVIYVFDNGEKLKRSGGTRAWRNCNPGNLRYTQLSKDNGAIGKAGGFAVFPTQEAGRAALAELLMSESYRNKTIGRAIFTYAPPHENNTEAYKRQIQRMTGLDINKKLSDLTKEQLESVIDAICVLEGWKTGQETKLAMTQKQINQNMQRIA